MAEGRREVTLTRPGLADGDDVDRGLKEAAGAEPFDLLPQPRREAIELERAKGLLRWQARLVEQALYAVGRADSLPPA